MSSTTTGINNNTPQIWDATMKLKVTGQPQSIIPFVVGLDRVQESYSLLGGDPDKWLDEPVPAVAIVYQDGWVLIDGGYEHGPNPLVEQVPAAKLDWDKVVACAVSHLHLDHIGGIFLVKENVPILIQRLEWEATPLVLPSPQRIYLLNGDTELAPGLTALDTAGHTPGNQSFQITLPDSTVVLACDAADLERNIKERIPCGYCSRPEGEEQARKAINRLADMEAAGVKVWPGHDPEWWAYKNAYPRPTSDS